MAPTVAVPETIAISIVITNPVSTPEVLMWGGDHSPSGPMPTVAPTNPTLSMTECVTRAGKIDRVA